MSYLPALSVKNRVIWVNPEFSNLPFEFKLGQASELGVFLTHASVEADQIARSFEIEEHHKRSGIVFRAEIIDASGRRYQIIDAKGIGYIKGPPKIQERYGSTLALTQGIFDAEDATLDAKMSEIFAGYGMNVPRTLAIIVLEEIVDGEGKRVSIQEARDKGILLAHLNPAIQIRAFGMRPRLQEVLEGRPSDFKGMFENENLARELGRNIGIMHQNGWKHGVLTLHNMTLDGGILDFDFVAKTADPKVLEQDFKQAEDSLHRFFGNKDYHHIFYESYTKARQ